MSVLLLLRFELFIFFLILIVIALLISRRDADVDYRRGIF